MEHVTNLGKSRSSGRGGCARYALSCPGHCISPLSIRWWIVLHHHPCDRCRWEHPSYSRALPGKSPQAANATPSPHHTSSTPRTPNKLKVQPRHKELQFTPRPSIHQTKVAGSARPTADTLTNINKNFASSTTQPHISLRIIHKKAT